MHGNGLDAYILCNIILDFCFYLLSLNDILYINYKPGNSFFPQNIDLLSLVFNKKNITALLIEHLMNQRMLYCLLRTIFKKMSRLFIMHLKILDKNFLWDMIE